MRIPGNSLANLPIWFDTRITKRPCFGNSRFPQRAQIMELFDEWQKAKLAAPGADYVRGIAPPARSKAGIVKEEWPSIPYS